ncbi:CpaF family protein [Dermabacteraceae bacterium P13136]
MALATVIEDDVRELIRRRGFDASGAGLEPLVREAVADYEARTGMSAVRTGESLDGLVSAIASRIGGFGQLQAYLDDPEVEEIWLNSPGELFCARRGRPELTATVLSEDEVRALVERMLAATGRRLDLSSPFVDAMLPDGSRLHAVIPPVTRRHWALNIRKFIARAQCLDDLVPLGSLTAQAARFLDAAVKSGLNFLVSGATGVGKTTFLNCLGGAINPRERVVTIEEVFELQLPLRDVVAMQCRQVNLEGSGEISMRRLVRESLRMRPGRIVVGEVREAESLDMLVAMNAGVPAMSSLHANSARDAVTKLCTLPLLAGDNVSQKFVVPTVANCIDVVVHLEMSGDGQRRVAEICALSGRAENGVVEVGTLFERRGGALLRGGAYPPHAERFAAAGFALSELLGG